MRLGIRLKFIAILVIASFLPLLLGLLSIQFLGKEIYCANKGSLFHSMARYTSRNVEQYLRLSVEHVHDWAQYSDLAQVNLHETGLGPETLGEDEQRAALVLNDQWPGLDPGSPILQEYMETPQAKRIRAFMKDNPLFVEVFLTDRYGRLVAISNKTSDYWQSDEVWWQQAAGIGPEQVYVEGIEFDESAGVYTLDVAVPVWAQSNGTRVFTGVLKAVLNAGPLFQSLPPVLSGNLPRREIVYDDGRILLELFGEDFNPLSRSMNTPPRDMFSSSSGGWVIAPVSGEADEVTGFAPLELSDDNVISGMRPMYVVVHDDLKTVMAPFHEQMAWVGFFGGVLVLAFFFVGDFIAYRKIIRPLKIIQEAAQQISLSANLSKELNPDIHEGGLSVEQASRVVEKVSKIQTKDEIEDLAGDFGRMSDRVINYHTQLEKEISTKTEEIQGDLIYAREFQEGLMSESYPQIPSQAGADPIELHFHHVYQAASSVSGDFFDIQKIDDHTAGILIADVMGHGARSALITAILKTLIQNLRHAAIEPGLFLTLMNEAFRNIIPPDEVIFATVLYLVVDTRKQTVTCCSAGHMPPLLVRRESGAVQPLYKQEESNYQYAIGLMPNTTYRQESITLQPRDVLLLYTDGVVEALNESGEEFGERLEKVIRESSEKDLPGLCKAIMEALHQFLGAAVSQDDVCLVAVEAAIPGSGVASNPNELE